MALIHQKIKRLRTERRLTLKDVASGIGVPLTTYREWEYGRSIRSEHLAKLANFFGVSADYLSGNLESDSLTLEQRLKRAMEDIAIVRAEIVKMKK